MNITELARQTRIPTPKLREILPQLGFDIGMKAIQVDDRIARKIIDKLSDILFNRICCDNFTRNKPFF